MYKVGLTGGIGCGKTTVADNFHALGVPIIDADQVSRYLVSPGQAALLEIAKVFGRQVIDAHDGLNRKALSDIIFSNPQQKMRLEEILHPLIYGQIEIEIDRLANDPNIGCSYCIIAIPLLFETHMSDFVDRILVVDCPETLQIQRVKARDQHSDAKILTIINSQVTRQVRCTQADDIIDNSVPKSQLAERVKKLHNLYLSYSKFGVKTPENQD